MIQLSHDQDFADIAVQLDNVVKAAGCPLVSIHYDGYEVVLEGTAPSFECKVRAEEQVRPYTNLAIRNCIRVIPS